MKKTPRTAVILQEQRVSVKNNKVALVSSLEEALKCLKKEIKEEGFKLLKQRPLSAKEIEDKLLAKGFLPHEVANLCQDFANDGWINDKKFTQYFIESYQKSRPLGEYALKLKLKEKGVDSLIIEQCLSDYYENNSALQEAFDLVKKNFYKYEKFSKMDQIKKITAYLFNRGYQYPLIEDVLKELQDQNFIKEGDGFYDY